MFNMTTTSTIINGDLKTPCNMNFKISSTGYTRRGTSLSYTKVYRNIPCATARDYINALDTSLSGKTVNFDIWENGNTYSSNAYETLPNAVANIDHFMKKQAYLSK